MSTQRKGLKGRIIGGDEFTTNILLSNGLIIRVREMDLHREPGQVTVVGEDASPLPEVTPLEEVFVPWSVLEKKHSAA